MLCWHVGVTKTGRDVSTFTHANELGLFSFPVPFSLPHSRYNHIKTVSKSWLSCLFFTLLSTAVSASPSPSFLLSVCLFVCLRGGNNFRFATHICVLCRLKVGNTFFACYLLLPRAGNVFLFFPSPYLSHCLSSSKSHSCAIFYVSSLV